MVLFPLSCSLFGFISNFSPDFAVYLLFLNIFIQMQLKEPIFYFYLSKNAKIHELKSSQVKVSVCVCVYECVLSLFICLHLQVGSSTVDVADKSLHGQPSTASRPSPQAFVLPISGTSMQKQYNTGKLRNQKAMWIPPLLILYSPSFLLDLSVTQKGSQFSVDPLKSVDFAFPGFSGRSLPWVSGHWISADCFFFLINQSHARAVTLYRF